MTKVSPIQNFVLPVKSRLESDRVLLVPWDQNVHAPLFYEAVKLHPSLFDWMTWGPFPTVESLQTTLHTRIGTDPSKTLYAVYAQPSLADKDGIIPANDDERFAGMVGLLDANEAHASVEIGFITTLPRWQRTCVTTHVNGLLLCHLLDPLPPHGDGLGLRRVLWMCNAENTTSRRAAERLGFVFEGEARWCRVLKEGKSGMNMSGKGRMHGSSHKGGNAFTLSIVWDEWTDERTRGKVRELMGR